jgi:hypothetical protein
MSDPPLDRAALAALKQEQILEFERDRWLAHKVLFANRHTDDSAPAHRDLTLNIYKPRARLLVEGFRGIGKTTTLEEVAIIRSLYREHRFMVILGASYTRACDRLEAIKNELVVNSLITHLYGSQKGHIWQDGKIVLSNGVCIAALGRDQSITGMKYLDWRPDAALVDDVEDPEENRNDAEREGTWRALTTRCVLGFVSLVLVAAVVVFPSGSKRMDGILLGIPWSIFLTTVVALLLGHRSSRSTSSTR